MLLFVVFFIYFVWFLYTRLLRGTPPPLEPSPSLAGVPDLNPFLIPGLLIFVCFTLISYVFFIMLYYFVIFLIVCFTWFSYFCLFYFVCFTFCFCNFLIIFYFAFFGGGEPEPVQHGLHRELQGRRGRRPVAARAALSGGGGGCPPWEPCQKRSIARNSKKPQQQQFKNKVAKQEQEVKSISTKKKIVKSSGIRASRREASQGPGRHAQASLLKSEKRRQK